jgi:hypothetical protein
VIRKKLTGERKGLLPQARPVCRGISAEILVFSKISESVLVGSSVRKKETTRVALPVQLRKKRTNYDGNDDALILESISAPQRLSLTLQKCLFQTLHVFALGDTTL